MIREGKFMRLPDKLRDLRKKHGLSQKELADKIGASSFEVVSWDNGDSVPDIAYIAKLADLYGVSPDFLLKDDKQEGQTIKADEEQDQPKKKAADPKRLGKTNSIYWTVVIAAYFLASIATGRWTNSLSIFLLGGAIWLIAAGFHWVNSTK